MGHNFGSDHDGTNTAANCPESGFVMAAVGCGNCPRDAGAPATHGDVGGLKDWSHCSRGFIDSKLQVRAIGH